MTSHEIEKFFEFVEKGSTAEVLNFFKDNQKRPWEFQEDQGFTALHRACNSNHNYMVVNMILQMKKRLGMDAPSIVKNWVNARSDQGFTALHFASYRGNYELISLLIEEGAEVEVINNEGLNVLHMAAQGNQPLSLVFFKEKYKMNLMSVDEVGSTPLHWAAYTGSKEAFIYLLSWNVDVNAQDKEGLTPLHLAVISERIQLIKKLLYKGANKELRDSKNRDPITLAREKNKMKIFDLLNYKTKCELFATKVPLKKLEKSNLNIYVFYCLHIIITLIVFYFNFQNIDLTIDRIIHLGLFGVVMLNYTFLLFSNPGEITNEFNTTLMALVENNLIISDYCPMCVVKKTFRSKHCLICKKCIDKFDHHCYWINKCIGGKNIFFFFSLLFFVLVNLGFNIFLSVYNMYIVISSSKENYLIRLSNFIIGLNIVLLLVFVIFFFPLLYVLMFNLHNYFSNKSKINKIRESELLLSNDSIRDTSNTQMNSF